MSSTSSITYIPPLANSISTIHENVIAHTRNALVNASIQEYRSIKKMNHDKTINDEAAFWIGALRDITAASSSSASAHSDKNPPPTE